MNERTLRLVSITLFSTVKLGSSSWFGLDVSTGLQIISSSFCSPESLLVTESTSPSSDELFWSAFGSAEFGTCGKRLLGGLTGSPSGLWLSEVFCSMSLLALFRGWRLEGTWGLGSFSVFAPAMNPLPSLFLFKSAFTGVHCSLPFSLQFFSLSFREPWSLDSISLGLDNTLLESFSLSASFPPSAVFKLSVLFCPLKSLFWVCIVPLPSKGEASPLFCTFSAGAASSLLKSPEDTTSS